MGEHPNLHMLTQDRVRRSIFGCASRLRSKPARASGALKCALSTSPASLHVTFKGCVRKAAHKDAPQEITVDFGCS